MRVITIDGLTDQERSFVEHFGMGMTQGQAAKAAGYAVPAQSATKLMQLPRVVTAIEAMRARNAEISDVSRRDVIDGLKEAIDMGRTLQDPVAMIAGWREVAKVCGHYEPVMKKIEISVNGQIAMGKLEQMPDSELAKLIEAEVIDVVEEPDA